MHTSSPRTAGHLAPIGCGPLLHAATCLGGCRSLRALPAARSMDFKEGRRLRRVFGRADLIAGAHGHARRPKVSDSPTLALSRVELPVILSSARSFTAERAQAHGADRGLRQRDRRRRQRDGNKCSNQSDHHGVFPAPASALSPPPPPAAERRRAAGRRISMLPRVYSNTPEPSVGMLSGSPPS